MVKGSNAATGPELNKNGKKLNFLQNISKFYRKPPHLPKQPTLPNLVTARAAAAIVTKARVGCILMILTA